MELLITLTLIYVVVLVLALAVSLITIWIYLRRIAGALEDVHAALANVPDETESLSPHLERLQQASSAYADDLTDTQERLTRANEHLVALVERLGMVETTR